MFHFKYFGVQRWDRWKAFECRMDRKVILITGPNGSGKSTMMNAFRAVLGIETFSDGRTIDHPVKNRNQTTVAWAVVTNTKVGRTRPFAGSDCHKDEVTLVCALNTARKDREFYILDGERSFQEITRTITDKRGHGLKEYQRELQGAGFTPQMRRILTIAQGMTKQLCEKNAHEVYDFVVRAKGAQDVIKRYDEAGQKYRIAQRNVREANAKLVDENNVLKVLDSRREEYHDFIGVKTRILDLEAQQKVASFAEAKRDVETAHQTVLQSETGLKDADEWIHKLNETLAGLAVELTELDKDFQPLQANRDAHRQEVSRLEGRIPALEARRDAILALRPDAADENLDVNAITDRLAEIRIELPRIEATLKEHREAVKRAKQALAANVLDPELHDLPSHIKPIADLVSAHAGWERAVEVVLRTATRDLVAIDVPPGDALSYLSTHPNRAIHLNAHEPEGKLGLLAHVDIAARLPRVILDALAAATPVDVIPPTIPRGKTYVTREGILASADLVANDHGPNATLSFGKEARRTQFEKELAALEELVINEASQVADTKSEHTRLNSQLPKARAVQMWRARQEELRGVEGSIAADTEALKLARTAAEAADNVWQPLFDSRSRIIGEQQNAGATLKAHEKKKVELEAALPAHRVEAARKAENAATLSVGLDPASITPERLSEARSVADVAAEHKKALARLDQMELDPEYCTDPTIDAQYATKAHDVSVVRTDIAKHERDVAAALEELKQVRIQFAQVVTQTLNDYRDRVKRLAEAGNIKIEMALENVAPDTMDDARLFVRVGFGGKTPVPMDSGDLSGGQKTITSILLMLGLAEDEDADGFFLIDEPYADLDWSNVVLVNRFLRSTNYQYVITVPTKASPTFYEGADMQLALQIAQGDHEFAPAPMLMERKRDIPGVSA